MNTFVLEQRKKKEKGLGTRFNMNTAEQQLEIINHNNSVHNFTKSNFVKSHEKPSQQAQTQIL